MLEQDVSFKKCEDEIHVKLSHLSIVKLAESRQMKNFLEREFSVKYHLSLFINLEREYFTPRSLSFLFCLNVKFVHIFTLNCPLTTEIEER